MMFHQVQAGRASEDIALQIESAILNQKLQPGDCLPSERELQTQFGTGRGVIREAIRALKQKGLIEIRKGQKGGAFIKQVDVANISESLALFLKQKNIGPYQVAEFRETIDQTVAQLAMVRATAEQHTAMLAAVGKLETFADDPQQHAHELGETDRQLNLLLASMTGNPIFEWVMQALQQGFSSHDNNLYQDPEFCRQTVENWRETATHLINREPVRLQAAVSQHYRLLQQCLHRAQQTIDSTESELI
ncbi:Pyruvate dehydrogenase complex repressor [Vibrio quintilis]|uniref:Pyruvate dehydrogenase complex repressor n=2 Tax=Vibrio quintilis TaxID=1117707 RepID=A0A1M7YWF5_9VIBR|nr:Pyruvate dehydrogenase complex repressor [Vibrio quintilis]